jgi:hypothetical protein
MRVLPNGVTQFMESDQTAIYWWVLYCVIEDLV